MEYSNDFDLIEFPKGDEYDAIDKMYKKYGKELITVAYKSLGDMDDARDVVQEVFLDFLEKRTLPIIKTSEKGYLIKAVWNQSQTLRRKRKSEQKKLLDYFFVRSVRKKPNAARPNRMRELLAGVDRIPPGKDRAILEAIIDGQETYAEIAAQFGCKEDHVQYIQQKYFRMLKLQHQQKK